MKSKIVSRKELKDIIKKNRKIGVKKKKIVTTNGSFDILHIGHVRFLQEAKKKGDILVVGVNSNNSVRQWKKIIGNTNWDKRPIIDEKDRAEMIASLECVDYVTIFDEPDCIKFVESVKPDIHVNGSDYGKNCIERDVVEKYGGKVHIIKLIKGYSTSALIKKILDDYKQ